MKKFVAALGGLLVFPAFGEVMPTIIEDVSANKIQAAENTDDTKKQESVQPVIVLSQGTLNPRASTNSISRATPAVPTTAATRTTPSRAISSRTATTTASRSAVKPTSGSVTSRSAITNNTVSRSGTSTVSRSSGANRNTASVTSRNAATTNTTAAAARSAIAPATASRISIAPTASTNSSLYIPRSATAAVLTSGNSTVATTVSTGPTMDELAQITDFCKAQYTDCMDNFCNVLDDNQGRCTCSPNVENYAETEAALKKATEELQEVAQQIQYIGLSAKEIETLFTQTEAELEMQGRTDSTQLANDLDSIKGLILDVETNSSISTTSSAFDLSGLLNLDFSNSNFNLLSMFGDNSNTSSINNQRGEELYKTATARCKASVLTDCATQGVDISVITNSYDLEIDKQCIAYERSLTDSNEQMKQTVFNAKTVLQNARLVVAQEKNTYDLRGCINALDSCMQDEFVCGNDYQNCMDPSGKFVSNGDIVIGSEPGKAGSLGGIYTTWNYGSGSNIDNAWSNTGSLQSYIDESMNSSSNEQANMVAFLKDKIGSNVDGVNMGMCMSVLNQCQDYTYDDNDNFKPNNEVIENFMQRTLITVKASQDELLSDYAENCTSDLMSCLVRNGYDEEMGTTSSVNRVAKNACTAIETTCASVLGHGDEDNYSSGLADQVMGNLAKTCMSTSDCEVIAGYTASCSMAQCRYVLSGTCTISTVDTDCPTQFANQKSICTNNRCQSTLDGDILGSCVGDPLITSGGQIGSKCYINGSTTIPTNMVGRCHSSSTPDLVECIATASISEPTTSCLNKPNGTECRGGSCYFGVCNGTSLRCDGDRAIACEVPIPMIGYVGYCATAGGACGLQAMTAGVPNTCSPTNVSNCPTLTGQKAYCRSDNTCGLAPTGRCTAELEDQLCGEGSTCNSYGECVPTTE